MKSITYNYDYSKQIELSKMITISLLAGGMPDRLLTIEKKIDEIKASITEA